MAGPTQFTSTDTRKWWLGFGSGVDGDLTISSNTTDTPIDSSCSGTAAATSLSATNASFAVGQAIMIHQTRGTGVGQWELNQIVGYTAGTITLRSPLYYTYTDSGASQAQVIVMKQYRSVVINSTKTLTGKTWGGDYGGILAFMARSVSGAGSINIAGVNPEVGTGGGFTGAGAIYSNAYGNAGEGNVGAQVVSQTTANGTGGGGGDTETSTPTSGGGGGGHAVSGSTAPTFSGKVGGTGGGTSGNAGLTNMTFGGGGGGGADSGDQNVGGTGGGIALIICNSIDTSSLTFTVNGAAGQNSSGAGAGGGGAGGSILIKAQTAVLGTNKITASGGAGGTASANGGAGGAGAVGRIHLDYVVSYSGTTTPTLDVTQDLSLRQPIKRRLNI